MTQSVLIVSPDGFQVLNTDHALTFARAESVRIKAIDSAGFTLGLAMRYQIVAVPGERGPYKVTTVGYEYEICNLDGGEIVLFHWHPWVPDEPETHTHVGGSQLAADGDIDRKTRLPSGRISIEDVISFCIANQRAKPLREDWPEILNLSKDTFERWKTWPMQEPLST